MDLPNYDEQPASPPFAGPGVSIRLAAPSFHVADPALLHGSYWMNAALIDLTSDDALRWIQVVAVQRDAPVVRARATRELALTPERVRAPSAPGVQSGGWFNLDVRAHLELVPGRYWVAAFLADHRTEWLPLELLAD